MFIAPRAVSMCMLLTAQALTLGCKTGANGGSDLRDDGAVLSVVPISASATSLNLGSDLLAKVPAMPEKGFNYPYYLFVPQNVLRDSSTHLYVEPNNTGTTSDDLSVHDAAAQTLISQEYPNQIARTLKVPLLVPVFPRPATPEIYTQYLTRDAMLVPNGPLKRIDLQMAAMIQHAEGLLRGSGVPVQDKVFMDGFSASSGFTLRFAAMHPDLVRATAAGGVNALPIFPVDSWQGTALRYPIGISDLQTIAGAAFNRAAYQTVSQYIHMGSLDTNDTVPFDDSWAPEDQATIQQLFGMVMMPNRWTSAQSVFASVSAPAQFVTYDGISHAVPPEIVVDIAKFFDANRGAQMQTIVPYKYVWRSLTTVHVTGAFWQGSADMPSCASGISGETFLFLPVSDWIQGEADYQLREFSNNAGFELHLALPGAPDIIATQAGNADDGTGNCQGFVAEFSDDQLNAITPNTTYTLSLVNHSTQYTWVMPPGTTVTTPASLVPPPSAGTSPPQSYQPYANNTLTGVAASIRTDLGATGCPTQRCVVLNIAEDLTFVNQQPLLPFLTSPTGADLTFNLVAGGHATIPLSYYGETSADAAQHIAFVWSLPDPPCLLYTSSRAAHDSFGSDLGELLSLSWLEVV